VRPIETVAKPASTPRIGLFALLGSLLCLKGTGMPEITQGSGAFKASRRLVLSALVTTIGVLAFASAPALASTEHGEHTPGTPFGGSGSGPAQFASLAGVATNEATGDVYVVDSGNNRVEYFNSTGKFEGEFAGPSAAGTGTLTAGSDFVESPVAKTGAFSVGEEITAAGGGLEGGTDIAGVLTPAEALKEEEELDIPVVPGLTLSTNATKTEKPASLTAHQPFAGPEGIAVDNDPSSPSYQDVYVADPDVADPSASVIDKFGPTGDYKGQITSAVGGSLEHLKGISVGASGVLWVYHNNENAEVNEIESYSDEEPNTFVSAHELPFESLVPGIAVASEKNSEGNLEDDLYVVTKASEVDKLNSEGKVLVKEFCSQKSVSGIAVESSSNDVYLDTGSAVVRCSPSGEVIESENMPVTGGQSSDTVAVNSSNGYVYATNAAAHAVDVFPPFAGAGIREEQASSVEAFGATLQALIDPNDYNHTTYHFEYDDTTPYTTRAAHGASTPDVEIPTGLSPVTISGRAKQLEASKKYYYRAVVESEVEGKTVTVDGPSQSFTTPAEPGSAPPQNCPTNEKLREEQPYGLALPDCRAYEMVSPPNTNGQDATIRQSAGEARASVSNTEPAVTYASLGAFGEGGGAREESQLLSRRKATGWSTQLITPLKAEDGDGALTGGFVNKAFTPELTEGLATSNSALAPGAEEIAGGGVEENLYVADFASSTYKYVARVPEALQVYGSTPNLRRIVFTPLKSKLLAEEWDEGKNVPVTVTNTPGEEMPASVGAQAYDGSIQTKNIYRAVSEDGERVFFTSPAYPREGFGQLYVRVNVAAPEGQSPLAQPEASGTGTLTAGSEKVTALAVATGELTNTLGGSLPSGSTLYPFTTASGKFHVGQQVSGDGIAPGTKITQIATGCYGSSENECLTLSEATTEEIGNGGGIHAKIFAVGPEPFEVGQKITGEGIPAGTTITEAVAGELKLSAPAAASGADVALAGGGGCTVAADACTIEVSASQRYRQSNPAGAQLARYWGASTDGSRVFFTSKAELTEDAYTGPDGNGANLYEYDVETGKLSDLTGETADDTGEGAAVQGVSQISEDGRYVYFVADGALAPGATEGEANLYVVHKDGAPVFIATLPANDISDWSNEIDFPEQVPGPNTTTTALAPKGNWFAFLANRALPTAESPAGYDDQQAAAGECDGEVFHGQKESEAGFCTEVYLYDAATGRLACPSCNPTGARPVGPSTLNTPADGASESSPVDLLEDGTLFFDSKDALVPGAASQHENVYEDEDGGIHAISDVAGGYESWFLDATPNGENVFFASADRLLPEDPGGNTVVWDARVDGGSPVAAPACTTAEACRNASPPTPGVYGPGPSETFSGPGNIAPPPPAVVKPKPKSLTRAQKLAAALKVCKKDKKKAKRVACEKQAKKKYKVAKKAAKRATNDRRGK
jgi:hypothetical protein